MCTARLPANGAAVGAHIRSSHLAERKPLSTRALIGSDEQTGRRIGDARWLRYSNLRGEVGPGGDAPVEVWRVRPAQSAAPPRRRAHGRRHGVHAGTDADRSAGGVALRAPLSRRTLNPNGRFCGLGSSRTLVTDALIRRSIPVAYWLRARRAVVPRSGSALCLRRATCTTKERRGLMRACNVCIWSGLAPAPAQPTHVPRMASAAPGLAERCFVRPAGSSLIRRPLRFRRGGGHGDARHGMSEQMDH